MNRNNKTPFVTKEEAQKKNWFLFDASGKTLGRMAAEIATILRGKHRPSYTPHIDCGDGVVIVNAEKIRVTGSKAAQKVYTAYTGHPGGLRQTPYRTMLARKPDFILRNAVKGMMPATKLGRAQMKRLRIFAGEVHGHIAQQPTAVNI